MASARFKSRLFLIALQDGAGFPAEPDAATDALGLAAGKAGTECEMLEDDRDRPFFGGAPFGTHLYRAFIKGDIAIDPPTVPGENLPPAHAVLAIGGMLPTLKTGATRYKPVSEGVPYATLDAWIADTFRRLRDVRAAISGLSLGIGKRLHASVQFIGFHDDVEQGVFAPDAPLPEQGVGWVSRGRNSKAQVRVANGATVPLRAESLSIDLGAKLTPKHYTSRREIGYDDRQATFTLRVVRTELDDFDPFAARRNRQLIVATYRTTNDDSYVELGIRGFIRGIKEVSLAGDYGWEITGPCICSDAGNDEFYLTWETVGGPAAPLFDSTAINWDSTLVSWDAS